MIRINVKVLALLLSAVAISRLSGQTDFKNYINGTQSAPPGDGSWAVFLGMTQTRSNIKDYLDEQKRDGTWINPFNGQSLKDVFVFGQDNRIVETARVITDHVDVHALDDSTLGAHRSFDYIICHSNGCTEAIAAVMSGQVSAKHIFAMGTDWTTTPIDSSKMRGTGITFFANRTDPVPKIIPLSIQRAGENTPGLGITLHVNDAADAARQLGNLATGKQPDADLYKTVFMEPRPGLTGLKAHDLTASYFPNVREWFSRNGETQQQVRGILNLPEARPEVPIRSYWTKGSPATPIGRQNQEATLMSDMARDAHRTVIAGEGPAAKQMYDATVKRVGPQNTLWVQKPSSASEIQSQARMFGAETILGVKPQTAPVPRATGPIPKQDPPRESSASLRPPKLGVPLAPPICPPGNPSCGGGGAALPHGGGDGPGGGGLASRLGTSGVGGVMLSNTAKVTSDKGDPSGLGNGEFSILFDDPAAGVDFNQFRKFVTAMWAVYFAKDGPGISIDPIAPGAEIQEVRYIGNVLGSDLGRVMREADYRMKKWAVGSERPDIPGFQSVDRLTKANGLRYLGAARRFWFVPEDMQFRQAGDALLFDSGRMTVKTEYITQDKEAAAEPADQAFAAAFTDRYTEIAERYPVYQELFEYAKLASLARYVKEKGVPLLWFLMANKDLAISETAPPDTVKALIKKSEVLEHVTIAGGVDLARHAAKERYVIDDRAFGSPFGAGASQTRNVSLVSEPSILTTASDRNYVSHPSSEMVVSGGTSGGARYQTDLALRNQGEPGLELVRYFDPAARSTEFGPGWRVMQPYRVEPASEPKIPFAGALVPEKMRVENLITGKVEVLTFNRTRYRVESYVPVDPETSSLLCIVWMNNGTVRLIDKLGNEFQFDGLGRTKRLIISKDYHIDYSYDVERAGVKAFVKPPYELKVDGTEHATMAQGQVGVPARFVLTDLRDGSKEVFTVDKNPSRRVEGWLPQAAAKSKFKLMALMRNGSFDVEDGDGNEIRFNGAGEFDSIRVPVLRGLKQGDQRIEFDYEYHGGQFRVRQARVMNEGLSASLYSIRYDYATDGKLASVTGPEGTVNDITYRGDAVSMIARK